MEDEDELLDVEKPEYDLILSDFDFINFRDQYKSQYVSDDQQAPAPKIMDILYMGKEKLKMWVQKDTLVIFDPSVIQEA